MLIASYFIRTHIKYSKIDSKIGFQKYLNLEHIEDHLLFRIFNFTMPNLQN